MSGRTVANYVTAAQIIGPLLEAGVDASSIGPLLTPSVMDTLIARVATRAANG